jgi:hypothetical protein
MARDQRALDTTLEMIARLRRIPRVRLLLSCRAFDLHTDPRLSSIEIKQTFSLSGFTDEQVQAVVQKVGAQFDALSPATRKLLSIPLHLDLFVMALEGQRRDAALPTGGLHTLQELYQLLWDNQGSVKVSSPSITIPHEVPNSVEVTDGPTAV